MLRILRLSLICLGCSGVMFSSSASYKKNSSAIDSTNSPSISGSDSTGAASRKIDSTEWPCGTYDGHTLYAGHKGGCYYYNSSKKKTYVDRSKCNC